MDSQPSEVTEVSEVSEALNAKSRTATLDQLRRKGRQSVKVIKAEDVASMITETVYRLLEDSEAFSPEDLERLVKNGTGEFKAVFAERKAESEKIETKFQTQRDELEAAQARIIALQQELADARSESQSGASADLIEKMMAEMAEMKANFQGGGDAGPGDAAVALLEQIGKRVGVSAAVEAKDVDLGGLFKDHEDTQLESNMEDVQLKKKTGGGIAANLARLKKLKGGD